MKCEACCLKGPGWPVHLDFSNLATYQKCCPWCSGTKEVTVEVAEVFLRLQTQPGVLSVRFHSLMSRAYDAKNAWDNLRTKKRPKGESEIGWANTLKHAEESAHEAWTDALDAEQTANLGDPREERKARDERAANKSCSNMRRKAWCKLQVKKDNVR